MKKFNTKQNRLESLKNREKMIIESFQRVFNKIKRIDEETVYQELDELDYNNLYANTNPWDKQQVKIDDYPAEGKNLEMNIRSAEMALNGDREQRHRFLMDDNEVQEYLNKLHKIKSALDKNKNGEELDDFEKKIVRFYKSGKHLQKSRISNMAGKKIDSDYVKNFDKSKFKEFQNRGLKTISRDRSDKNEYKVFITDIRPEEYSDGVRFRVDCTVQGQEGTFVIYADGSNGFLDNQSEGINWKALYIADSEFRKLASSELNNIRPARNY